MMWSRFRGQRLMDLVPEGIVDLCPEGTADRSQAIYCLEPVQSKIRPVGHGLILTHGGFVGLIVTPLSDPIITSPTGRFPLSNGSPPIHSRATTIAALLANTAPVLVT